MAGRFRRHALVIYGGCVTRDTFEDSKANHKLLAYISRQSLICAGSRPTKLLTPLPPSAGFEARNFNGDISSSLYGTLERYADSADLSAFDLVVEGLGVLRLADNTFVTRSGALAASGRMEKLPAPRSYRFDTEGHHRTWEVAARKFVDVLTTTGLLAKTLMVETPWAKDMDDGEELPLFRGLDPVRANEIYERYYAFLRHLGVRSVRSRQTPTVGARRRITMCRRRTSGCGTIFWRASRSPSPGRMARGGFNGCGYGDRMATQLRPGSGDKLADIERYAQDLRASDIPAEAFVGENLLLILKGKN
jgi:hypothetical protein